MASKVAQRGVVDRGYPLGVIFDMDGVLIDSYWAHFKSWERMAVERGLRMTVRQFDATFGRTSREILAALWPEAKMSDREIAAADAYKEAIFRQILDADFPAMPGARELLYQLYGAGIGVAIGSSGPPENVAMAQERLGARAIMAATVTGMDVKRGKPDPEVFLLAAYRLGIPPQRCCVVEDAPLGIEAAHRAGMAAIGIASTGRTRPILAAADRIIDSLTELSPQAFRAVLARKRQHGIRRCV